MRPADIITAAAAGNYVEFRLQDGHRPLMRATLSRVEATLSAHGFVRTHRSWLVNAAHLRSVAAEGSGDYQLELHDVSKRRSPGAFLKPWRVCGKVEVAAPYTA